MGKRLAAVTLLVIGSGLSSAAQDIELLPRTGKIANTYKTYSLFLICNPDWIKPEKSAGLATLYEDFKSFGRSIGDDNVAVWFLSGNAVPSDPSLAQNIDVERSVRFCKAWKLKPSDGPHVVVTSSYPDETKLTSGLPPNSFVFELGNMAPPDISHLISKLTDELIQDGKVDPAATAARPPQSMWIQILDAAEHLIGQFGCTWTLKVDAGPLKADLHSCQSQGAGT